MIFASKTPRDLNRDPAPYKKLPPYNVGRSSWPILHPHAGMITEYDPRPRYDHVQHNEPNPVLGQFRRDVAETGMSVTECAQSWIDGESFDDTDADDHARRVLTRLARLMEGASA